jgi:ABC-type multidrug transport system permease subunit
MINSFEPTILGMIALFISVAEVNSILQSILLLLTIIYTGYKILEIIKKNK